MSEEEPVRSLPQLELFVEFLEFFDEGVSRASFFTRADKLLLARIREDGDCLSIYLDELRIGAEENSVLSLHFGQRVQIILQLLAVVPGNQNDRRAVCHAIHGVHPESSFLDSLFVGV